ERPLFQRRKRQTINERTLMEPNFPGMYYQWIEAWNGGDIDLETIFHRGVVVRQMPKEQHGIEAIHEMLKQGRAPFDPLHFTIDVEPVFDDHMLAARWKCHGVYQGGLPGVS